MTRVETTLRYANKDGTAALRIPEEARCLFPPDGNRNKNSFTIKSGAYADTVWVSTPHGPYGHPHIHIMGTDWFKALSPKPKDKDKVVIEVTESKGQKEYRLL